MRLTGGYSGPRRSQQQKDDLARGITDAVEAIAKAPRDQTIVVIQEVSKENYYIAAKRGRLTYCRLAGLRGQSLKLLQNNRRPVHNQGIAWGHARLYELG